MKLLSGRSHKVLACKLSKILCVANVDSETENFQDQEIRVQIKEPLYGEDVIILQSTSKPANDNLMELLLLVDAAKRAGAEKIIAAVPYFGYSRQDRASYEFGPISASLVANLMINSGIDSFVAIDLHSRQIEGFFKNGVYNISPIEVFKSYFELSHDSIIVSPDIGGVARAQDFSQHFDLDLAIINKSRDHDRNCHMSEIVGDIKNKHCVIIDDIVDTAGTLCKAAALLKKNGAASIVAYITHSVLSGQAKELIEGSVIEKIFVSDSITHEKLPNKFEVVTIADVLSNALEKLVK